jgi:hypothetical protein
MWIAATTLWDSELIADCRFRIFQIDLPHMHAIEI